MVSDHPRGEASQSGGDFRRSFRVCGARLRYVRRHAPLLGPAGNENCRPARGKPDAPSARAVVDGKKAFARVDLPHAAERVCASASVRAANRGEAGVTLLRLRTPDSRPVARVILSPSGKLVVRSDVARAQSNTGVALGGGWRRLQFCVDVDAALVRLVVAGTQAVAWSVDVGDDGIGEFQIGESQKRSFRANFDSLRVVDADR